MQITSHQDIIDLWPSVADFARDVGEKATNVHSWRLRNSIPEKHYPEVVKAAVRAGVSAVSIEVLQATSPSAWRGTDMRREVERALESIVFAENRIMSVLPRHMAMAKLRGEKRLPDLAGTEKKFAELRMELSLVSSAFI